MPTLIPPNVDHITPDHFIHHAIRQGEHRARAHNIRQNLELLGMHRPFDQSSISHHLRLLEHENAMAQKLASETDGIFQRYEEETRKGADKHTRQKVDEMQKQLQHTHEKEKEELHKAAGELRALHADIQSELSRTRDEHGICTAQLRKKQVEYEDLQTKYLICHKLMMHMYNTFDINEDDKPDTIFSRLNNIYSEHKQLEKHKKDIKQLLGKSDGQKLEVNDILEALKHYKTTIDRLEAEIRNLTQERDEYTETIQNHMSEMEKVAQVHGNVDAHLRSLPHAPNAAPPLSHQPQSRKWYSGISLPNKQQIRKWVAST